MPPPILALSLGSGLRSTERETLVRKSSSWDNNDDDNDNDDDVSGHLGVVLPQLPGCQTLATDGAAVQTSREAGAWNTQFYDRDNILSKYLN